jgi:hypothetical protein
VCILIHLVEGWTHCRWLITTTPEADRILFERDVVVVPDILANAGGVRYRYG